MKLKNQKAQMENARLASENDNLTRENQSLSLENDNLSADLAQHQKRLEEVVPMYEKTLMQYVLMCSEV